MIKKKNILIVDRYFYPDFQATSVLLTDLAGALAFDFNVTVLCGPASSFRDEHGSSPKAVTIRTIPSLQFNHPTFFERFLIYSSFLLFAPLALLFSEKPDVVLVQSSPPLLPFVISIVCQFRKIPYVYVCQDLFPGTAIKSGQLSESTFTKLSERCHHYAAEEATRVVAIGRDMKDLLLNEGIPSQKVEIIPNWANEVEIKPLPKENAFSKKHNLKDHFIIMHSGNFGLVQDFDFLLEVAKELEGNPNIRMVFVGNGASKEQIVKKSQNMKIENTVFIPFAPKETVSEVLSSADLQLISLKSGLAGHSIPSKIYSLLASGSAILGLLEKKSEVALTIEEANCGFVIEKKNAHKTAEIITELSKSMNKISEWKKNARNFSEQMNFRKNAIKKYKQILMEA